MTPNADDRGLLDRIVWRCPPRRYHLDDYKRWFPRSAAVMLRYLKHFDPLPDREGVSQQADAPAIGFVVCPWVSTPVPWYSIMLAIGEARRGRNVVLFWDDTGFPEARLADQQRAIQRVLARTARLLPVVRVSDAEPAVSRPGDQDVIDSLTNQNLTWRRRGGPPNRREVALPEKITQALAHSLPLVRGALGGENLDCLVVPGGIYGSSGLFLQAADEIGCRGATFDVDRQIAQICVSGIAAQNADVPRAFNELWDSGEDARRDAIDVARSEFTRRTNSSDSYGFQTVPERAGVASDDIAAVIPMNVEWDSAALGRHATFTDTVDWITSTIAAILDEDTGVVVVRQHPSERRPLQRSRFDVASVLRDRFGDNPRLRFVGADDPTNTYELLRAARLVLPFVSTIGIEAAAIGKPVLVSGASYYDDLGFVWSARSRDEYSELLRRGLRGDLPPLPDQSDRAWICYYLSAVQNRIETDFTAFPDDFWTWCRRAPDSLFADPEVADILEAIDTDTPVSLLRHRRLSSPSDAAVGER